MKIKAVCGALIGSVVAVQDVSATTGYLAHDAIGGAAENVSIVTYRGDAARSFLPAYRERLEQEVVNGGPFAAAAKARLASLNKIFNMQVFIVTPLEASDESNVASNAVLSANALPPPGFPLNPSNGQIVGTQGCYNESGNMFAEDDQWQYSSATGSWLQIRSNKNMVTVCPYPGA